MEVFIIAGCPQGESYLHNALIRDGPLENLWGGGGARSTKKTSSKKKFKKKKKFSHPQNSPPPPPPPHNFSNGPSLIETIIHTERGTSCFKDWE